MKKTIMLIVCLLLCSCYNGTKLNTFGMPHTPTVGPKDYLQGWEDGCRTGIASYGNAYLRTHYQTTVNAEKMKLPHYQKGWEVGQSYCSYYTSSYLSNTELTQQDARSSKTWFSLKGDGFFSYSGLTSFNSSFNESDDSSHGLFFN